MIMVTAHDHTPLMVRKDSIVSVYVGQDDVTTLDMGGSFYYIKESVEQVFDMLNPGSGLRNAAKALVDYVENYTACDAGLQKLLNDIKEQL